MALTAIGLDKPAVTKRSCLVKIQAMQAKRRKEEEEIKEKVAREPCSISIYLSANKSQAFDPLHNPDLSDGDKIEIVIQMSPLWELQYNFHQSKSFVFISLLALWG